jgi:hypothetical protein
MRWDLLVISIVFEWAGPGSAGVRAWLKEPVLCKNGHAIVEIDKANAERATKSLQRVLFKDIILLTLLYIE